MNSQSTGHGRAGTGCYGTRGTHSTATNQKTGPRLTILGDVANSRIKEIKEMHIYGDGILSLIWSIFQRLPFRPLFPLIRYPQSNSSSATMFDALTDLANNRDKCGSFWLDTLHQHSNENGDQGRSHHQGLARSHQLSDGSIYFFLTQSMYPDFPDNASGRGQLMRFRYEGSIGGPHVASDIASMEQLLEFDDEWHPADVEFLPDLNGRDAGYLFVSKPHVNTEPGDGTITILYWQLGSDFTYVGDIAFGTGSNFVTIDRIDDDYYYLWSGSLLFRARASELFPSIQPGTMDCNSFEEVAVEYDPHGYFDDAASQVKLYRDAEDQWWMLGFRSDPSDDPGGTDYIDAYRIEYPLFQLTEKREPEHIYLRHGDTAFANTGTHYVDPVGRLLVSSSYRWSRDEGLTADGWVSRVDELPSF